MPTIDNPLDPKQDIISAALRAQQNVFNRSNVNLGKVVFGVGSTSTWTGDDPSNVTVSTTVAVPEFATQCAFIAETRFWGQAQWGLFDGAGDGWGSPGVVLTAGVTVSCGSFSKHDSGNQYYSFHSITLDASSNLKLYIGSSSAVPLFGVFDCAGQSTVTLQGTLTGGSTVSCGVNAGILCLFEY